MQKIRYTGTQGEFSLKDPENYSYLYFPLASETGLKSALTPDLGGDSKIDQEHFLLQPVSADDLQNNRSTRNFWAFCEGACWSLTGASAQQESVRFTKDQEESELKGGLMWQSIYRKSSTLPIEAEVTSFVPVQANAEVHIIRIRNLAKEAKQIGFTAAIPLYGRSADNIRDHRNVTSMLHRIHTFENGVVLKPTMSFDERGHRLNHTIYYAAGVTGMGKAPDRFFPTVDSWIGEGGTFLRPRAAFEETEGVPAGLDFVGKEAMGGLQFLPQTVEAGEEACFVVLCGITQDREAPDQASWDWQEEALGQVCPVVDRFGSLEKATQALNETKEYWQRQVNVAYHTQDPAFDNWMRWVSFQPYLRRLFGCSFLPHHDYGRGGRGWRDLWQDCLSLLIMDPKDVRRMIVGNLGGVRIDGTNATIIGEAEGEFIADRNGIARVWMDHAYWPLSTTRFYLDQTGDLSVLLEKTGYFKDAQARRGRDIDPAWRPEQGLKLKTQDGAIYEGTVLEHLLVENLAAFYETGSHGNLLLRGADWNDALDMASHQGESVAFTAAFAGNFMDLADVLRKLEEQGIKTLTIAKEIGLLLAQDQPGPDANEKILGRFLDAVTGSISGETMDVSAGELARTMEEKGRSMMERLRRDEWLPEGWYNSYYDDHGRRVEGGQHMMLTGQVFSIMSGTATDPQIGQIVSNADRLLYDGPVGGYRLNTNFREIKMDMGRMFGFAYGEKENGAVFSHMTVMFANALYRRGFSRQGYKALETLSRTARNFETSRMLPGIPEYFTPEGRGVYQYLTGAASWYMMTMVTYVFGVRGSYGDLLIAPQLVAEQFDSDGKAGIELVFAGKDVSVEYTNEGRMDAGAYTIKEIKVNGEEMPVMPGAASFVLPKTMLEKAEELKIQVTLA